MKKRIELIFILIVVILIFTIVFQQYKTYARIGGRDNWGSIPVKPSNSGSPGNPPSNNPSTNTDTNKYIDLPYYPTINGNVYDQGIDKGIKDVKVQLLSGDNVVETVLTDENGNYSISPSPGNYRLRFVCGDIDGIDQNDSDRIKNVLKYNGQDYSVVENPSSSGEAGTHTLTEKNIITMGKNAIQVMLVIDNSWSTRDNKINYYGREMSVLDAEVDATKKLISKLLSADQGIYITLIFFNGGDHYRALETGLSRDQEAMNKALDSIADKEPIGGTDIENALITANDSFVVEDDNKDNTTRVIALMTDGVPTGCEGTRIYENDSDDVERSKLDTIINQTRKKLKELKDDGIKIFSMVVEPEDDEEKEYVKKLFVDSQDEVVDNYTNILDGNGLNDYIENWLAKYIKQTHESSEEISNIRTWNIDYYNDEDKNRGIEIADNFKDGFNWNNLKSFRLIEDYNPSDYDEAKELSKKTYFTITSNETYRITAKDSRDGQVAYNVYDSDTGEVKETYYYRAVENDYTANLKLEEKPAAQLNINQYASGLRVTLANGQILYFDTANYETEDIRDIKSLICYIDNELAQGAKVEIEYAINIASPTSCSFNDLKLADFIPDGFIYDLNAKLLTEDNTNEKYWDNISNNKDLFDENSGHFNDLETNDNETKSKINNAKKGQVVISKPISLNNVGETNSAQLKIVVSRVLSNSNDLDKVSKDNTAEVYEYKTKDPISAIYGTDYNEGTPRRMKSSISGKNTSLGLTAINDIGNKLYVYPGSFEGTDYTTSSDSNQVLVIPPTGKEIPRKAIIILISIACCCALMIFIAKEVK